MPMQADTAGRQCSRSNPGSVFQTEPTPHDSRGEAVSDKRPNVLFMIADHARHDAVACNHNPDMSSSLASVVKTPNLDRLARSGVTFRNSYTTNPICVPARACITTGNYSHKCTDSKANGGSIRDGQPKLARHFAESGYATIAVGKLHYVPYSPPGRPRLLHGFQVAELNEEGRILRQYDPKGELEGLEDYHDYLKGVGWGGYERAHGAGNNDVHPTVSPLPAEHYADAWVADRAIARLREHLGRDADRPFLLMASFTKPHSPYDPPRPYDAMYDPRKMPPPLGGWDDEDLLSGRDVELRGHAKRYGWDRLPPQTVQLIRARYCGLMSFQDVQVGRLLDFLEEAGIAGDTIVIYTADHGDLLGDLGRLFKSTMYDGASRVPMLWRAPGLIPDDGPPVREQLACSVDFFPTLCSLTGVPAPCAMDGVDLSEALRDPDARGREYLVSQSLDPPTQKYMVRTPQWKYLYSELGGVEELYDVRRRDHELHNLAAEPDLAPEVARLRDTLIRWCIENGDDAMVRDGRLVASPEDALPPAEFQPGSMGWRRY